MSDRCAAVEPLHSAWLDNVLAPADAARVAAHVRRCHDCRTQVEALDRTRRALGNLPVRRVPSALLDSPESQAGPVHGRRPGALAGAATALMVLVGAVAGAAFAVGGETREPPPTITVPVDVFVADHLVRTVGGHVGAPLVVDTEP